jgi:hypothetical protein
MSDSPLRLNPAPRLQVVAFGDRVRCLLVDDAVLEPERWRAYAVACRDAFRAAPTNAFPGVEMPAPPAVADAFAEFFRRHVQRHFAMRRLAAATVRFSLVTLAPEHLQPRQWIPHRDSAWVDPGHVIAASVLYLFDDPGFGGTAFYAPRQGDAATQRLVHDASTLDAAAFMQRHPVAPGYTSDGGACFERLGGVEPRFNRMVFYDGRIFHSGDIPDPGRLSPDPAAGRLTVNGFFSGRANATA